MDVDEEDELFMLTSTAGDPVQAFLGAKARSVRAANEQLRATIAGMTTRTCRPLVEAPGGSDAGLIIGSACKKQRNGKWCFIVNVTSLNATVIYKNFDVSLGWCPVIAPNYTLSIYLCATKKFVSPDSNVRILNDLRLIITMDAIGFDCHKRFEAEAMLFYDVYDSNASLSGPPTRRGIKLPTLVLDVVELTQGTLDVSNKDLLDGVDEAILAACACSVPIRAVVTLPTTQSDALRDRLVIDCAFVEAAHFLLLLTVSDALNGCMLRYRQEDDGIYIVDMFVKSREHLQNVLHHIYGHIRDVHVMPLRCRAQVMRRQQIRMATHQEAEDEDDDIFSSQMYLEKRKSVPKGATDEQTADLRRLRRCLRAQIMAVDNFRRCVVSTDDGDGDAEFAYCDMRACLTKNERVCDELYELFKCK